MSALLDVIRKLTDEELDQALRLASGGYFPTGRDEQIPPAGDWFVWLILAGRGFGKTRTGAEWVADQAMQQAGTRWAVVAPTYSDARDTCVEGESGLIAVLRRRGITAPGLVWNRSLGEVVLPNGSRIKLFSADEPDRLRGPQHHGAWCDELAAWRYPETWDQLQFGLRLGDDPRTVVTTTPRPVPLVRQLLDRRNAGVKVTVGSTFDNAENLAPAALAELRARYEGTRLGRQELYAELLDDVDGALWTRAVIEAGRVQTPPHATDWRPDPRTEQPRSDMARIVVAVDPSGGSTEGHDEQGIVVVGKGADGHLYVLADLSCRLTPDGWGSRAVDAYRNWSCDRLVWEANYGGEMVEQVVRTAARNQRIEVATKKVTASRGKRLRAEPVAALYEQGRVHHVGGFPELEDQMCSWTPDSSSSPDRLDALVWAVTELALEPEARRLSFRGAA